MTIDGMLTGIRILDSTTAIAMPTALTILSDMGAEVIKVESHSREGTENRGEAFQVLQRNRLGVTVNLRATGGLELFKNLITVCDVLMENNRAGTFARLGLGYDEVRKANPTIIMLSNTGFGQTGPWKRYTGHGTFIEHDAGMGYFTGYQDQGPRQVGNAWIDIHAAWLSVFAVISALYHRAETGEGQYIDFSMYESGVTTMGVEILDYIANGNIGQRMANRHPYFAPHGVYPCRGDDKWIAISVESDGNWRTLCELMANPDLAQDPRFGDSLSRMHHQDDIDPIITSWTRNLDVTELMAMLQGKGIPASTVPDASEVMTDTHLKARGFFEKMIHSPESEIGTRVFPGRPWKGSKTPSRFRRPAPYLGEHNEYVFGEILGINEAEIEKLYETGMTAKLPPQPGKSGAIQARTGGRSGGRTKPITVENGGLAGIDPDYERRLGLG